jgi:hypothetical protein
LTALAELEAAEWLMVLVLRKVKMAVAKVRVLVRAHKMASLILAGELVEPLQAGHKALTVPLAEMESSCFYRQRLRQTMTAVSICR